MQPGDVKPALHEAFVASEERVAPAVEVNEKARPGLFSAERNPLVRAFDNIGRYWINDGPKLILVVFYLVVSVGLFMQSYWYFRWGPGKAAYPIMGEALTWARGSANAIKWNSFLILFFVCRNFISWLRGTWLNNIIPFDKNIIAHRHVAWAIAFWSAIHTFSHCFNWLYLSSANSDELHAAIPKLKTTPSVWAVAFLTIPGATGHFLVMIMVLMYTSSIASIRRPFFETFWYTHHLFILYFAAGIVHGQSNLLERANFWIWVTIPIIVYTIERVIRFFRARRPAVLVKCVQHPSRVLELQMRCEDKSGEPFRYKPGQYLFLNSPYLARQEWHPFTISSAPQEEFFSCHIRIVGDWTGRLYEQMNPDKVPAGVVQENKRTAPNGQHILRIDGPYGAASEDVFRFKSVLLVGAGIGVTPFASILKSLRYHIARALADGADVPLDKVTFVWVSRDKGSFEWFGDLLAELEKTNPNNFLEIKVYLTGYLRNEKEIRDVMHSDLEAPDAVTGLRSHTYFGRPNWDSIFDELKAANPDQKVGVFFCGPPVVSKQLYRMCRKKSSRKGTRFVYHKENF